ncbi:hypothetical protein BDV59DRAFT_166788 [Aspergillus ambiguus]|uniref:uncharacterized protein n=1 Tax=Aspergillus ambiguus TaxID=176160 RepID=UPI003CCD7A90
MKVSAALLLGFVPAILAEAIVVTYPSGTPDQVVEDAKNAITSAGGCITHTFTLLKGFSAQQVNEAMINQISVETAEYKPTIEKDQEYTTQ